MHPLGTRGFRAAIVARARFIEDLVAEQAAAGVTQYVILGAGLDTLAQRRPELGARLRVFEVDQPGTQAWKRRRLIELGFGIPDWLRLVPVDFEAGESWWDGLSAAGFDPGRPAVVASTGVSMYLTKDATAATLRQLAALAPGSTLAMTFLLPAELVDEADRPGLEASTRGARASGTPFISFYAPDEMLALARAAGFPDARHVSSSRARRALLRGSHRRPSPVNRRRHPHRDHLSQLGDASGGGISFDGGVTADQTRDLWRSAPGRGTSRRWTSTRSSTPPTRRCSAAVASTGRSIVPQVPASLDVCRLLGGCATGDAKVTPGFDLAARWIVHTVGPVWHGGDGGEPDLLMSCYRRSLACGAEVGARSMAFPAISTGVYGYPPDLALRSRSRRCARPTRRCSTRSCWSPSTPRPTSATRICSPHEARTARARWTASRLVALRFDADDPLRLARFWADALRWEVDDASPDAIGLARPTAPGSASTSSRS